jgi:hypothetical protein
MALRKGFPNPNNIPEDVLEEMLLDEEDIPRNTSISAHDMDDAEIRSGQREPD